MILKPSGTDVKKLPLGAVEGFVLSQVDGLLDLEGIAEITGLDSATVERVAERLLELGAVVDVGVRVRPKADLPPKPRFDPRADREEAREDPRGDPPEPSRPASSRRFDPRAEESVLPPKATPAPKSVRPKSIRAPKTMRPPKTDGAKTNKTVRPPKPSTVRPPKSVRAPKISSAPPPPRAPSPITPQVDKAPPSAAASQGASSTSDSATGVDEATLAAIVAIEARMASAKNHYELFELPRDAEKKAIKRAYFAFAAKYHPDRFFGKKIGDLRGRIELMFRAFTDAHDALVDADLRRAYDARLPPPPPARPSRKMSKAMRAVSRRMEAVKAPSTVEEENGQSAPESAPKKPPSGRPAARVSTRLKAQTAPAASQAPASASGPTSAAPVSAKPVAAPTISAAPSSGSALGGSPSTPAAPGPISARPQVTSAGPVSGVISNPPVSARPVTSSGPVSIASSSSGPSSGPMSGPSSGPVSGPARAADLRAGMTAARDQARIDMLVKAGEEAMAANDIVGAANNYRLALEHREDRRLRFIFEDLDARAKTLRFEKHMSVARNAERDERWADAAASLQRANDAKPDCDVAARAATALRRSGGDLTRATKLAEQAVATAPRNAHYRLALAAVHLANNKPTQAREESEMARKLAPKDDDVLEMAAEIEKKA